MVEEEMLDFKNLRLMPGEKLVLLDRRQFGHDEERQSIWECTLREVFAKEAEKTPQAKLDEWDFRWATLPAGDTVLLAGILPEGESPDAEGKVPAALIAIVEEKWTAADFIASIGDGRFFGPDCEIKRITDAEPKDGQALLAYVEQGDVFDPGTNQTTFETINQGVVDSLQRDYDVRTYQITSPELYALKLCTYARRWDHKASKKSALMEPKRVTDQQAQVFLLSYAFRPAVVGPVLDRFGTPGEAFLALKQVPWTPKGNISKKGNNPFESIPYCGSEGLWRANSIVWKKAKNTAEETKLPNIPAIPQRDDDAPISPKETPPAKVVHRSSPGFGVYKPPEDPSAKAPLAYADNEKLIDESFRERTPAMEDKLLSGKRSLTREEIRAKITDDDVKDL
jgi:ERCC4-type nuclease